jgi:hypothetical protein
MFDVFGVTWARRRRVHELAAGFRGDDLAAGGIRAVSGDVVFELEALDASDSDLAAAGLAEQHVIPLAKVERVVSPALREPASGRGDDPHS